jgi:hypothetical protein
VSDALEERGDLLVGCLPVKGFAGSVVEFFGDGIEVVFWVDTQVYARVPAHIPSYLPLLYVRNMTAENA